MTCWIIKPNQKVIRADLTELGWQSKREDGEKKELERLRKSINKAGNLNLKGLKEHKNERDYSMMRRWGRGGGGGKGVKPVIIFLLAASSSSSCAWQLLVNHQSRQQHTYRRCRFGFHDSIKVLCKFQITWREKKSTLWLFPPTAANEINSWWRRLFPTAPPTTC